MKNHTYTCTQRDCADFLGRTHDPHNFHSARDPDCHVTDLFGQVDSLTGRMSFNQGWPFTHFLPLFLIESEKSCLQDRSVISSRREFPCPIITWFTFTLLYIHDASVGLSFGMMSWRCSEPWVRRHLFRRLTCSWQKFCVRIAFGSSTQKAAFMMPNELQFCMPVYFAQGQFETLHNSRKIFNVFSPSTIQKYCSTESAILKKTVSKQASLPFSRLHGYKHRSFVSQATCPEAAIEMELSLFTEWLANCPTFFNLTAVTYGSH